METGISATLWAHTHAHTHTTVLWLYGFCQWQPEWAGTRRNIHPLLSWSLSLICFVHLLRSMAYSLINPRAWLSFSTVSLQVFFGLPLGLAPSTSYSIHIFTQSLSFFCSTCPYHRNCFTVVLRLCHLILVSLSTLYLEFYLVVSCHTSI